MQIALVFVTLLVFDIFDGKARGSRAEGYLLRCVFLQALDRGQQQDLRPPVVAASGGPEQTAAPTSNTGRITCVYSAGQIKSSSTLADSQEKMKTPQFSTRYADLCHATPFSVILRCILKSPMQPHLASWNISRIPVH